jgi:hypothetical protein
MPRGIGYSASACGGSEVKIQRAILSIAAAVVAVTMGGDAPGAKERSSNLSSQVLQKIAKVEAEIDRTEAQATERLAAPPDNQIQQIELLGKLMLYDKDLSVNPQRGLRLQAIRQGSRKEPFSEAEFARC